MWGEDWKIEGDRTSRNTQKAKYRKEKSLWEQVGRFCAKHHFAWQTSVSHTEGLFTWPVTKNNSHVLSKARNYKRTREGVGEGVKACEWEFVNARDSVGGVGARTSKSCGNFERELVCNTPDATEDPQENWMRG